MKIQLPAEYEFLHFDRFDVHVKGKALTETQIEQVKEVIASTTALSLKGLLSRQLGIYYGFHLRSAKQASEYCRIWQSTIEDQTSEAYAEACNHLGFSESIDGGYRDPALFETALAIYQELEKAATEADDLQEIKLNQAFAMRYIGVTTRRQGIQLDKAGDVVGAGAIFEQAFQILSDVIAIQQINHANPIDLAESFHLLGVFYQSRKRIPEAEASLQQALAAWEDVVRTTGPHPIKFVTMQSLYNIQMLLKKTTDAINLLQHTRVEQESYFGTEIQDDIGKTMHYLGEAYEANLDPDNALTAYRDSLRIKKAINSSAAMIQVTESAIYRLEIAPERITNNFRWQQYIDEGLIAANNLLRLKSETATILTSTELVALALIYLEVGDWTNVDKYASEALKQEEKSAAPSDENKARALYALATSKRERHLYSEALEDFDRAKNLAKSDWLIGNILRNKGLVFLNLKQYQEAANLFQEAIDFTSNSPDLKLRGSLPALANYLALCLFKKALACNEDLTEGLAKLAEATELYRFMFQERGWDEQTIIQLNDYISHCAHRGKILLDQLISQPLNEKNQNDLQESKTLLISAFKGRKENQVDGIRLGDVCVDIGHVSKKLKNYIETRQYYRQALFYYALTTLPKNTKKIADIQTYLDEIYSHFLPSYGSTYYSLGEAHFDPMICETNWSHNTSNHHDELVLLGKMSTQFKCDWNDEHSIRHAKVMISEVQKFIDKNKNYFYTCTNDLQYQWAQLFYQVATFYLHITYNNEVPDRLKRALEYLEFAGTVLQDAEQDWVINQIACCIQQQMNDKSTNSSDKLALSKKLSACNVAVISRHASQENEKSQLLTAFAYCTKAQGAFALGNIIDAVNDYRKALDIYELASVASSHQYLRAKNVYANYLLRAGQFDLAETTYSELHNAWQMKQDCSTNLFAGRFYVGYAKFLRDNRRNSPEALKQFETAQSILTAAGAHEFAREIEQDIQLLREVCARVSARENASSPHFHRPGAPSHPQPMENTSSLTATNASMKVGS